jgi:hypothetical protein
MPQPTRTLHAREARGAPRRRSPSGAAEAAPAEPAAGAPALSAAELAAFIGYAEEAAERHAARTPADALGRQWSFEQAVVGCQAVVLIAVRRGPELRQQALPVNRFSREAAEAAVRTLDRAFAGADA